VAVRESYFLFRPRIEKYLEQLHKKSVDLQYAEKEISRATTGQEKEKEKAVVHRRELFEWFQEQFDEVRRQVQPYLSMGHVKS